MLRKIIRKLLRYLAKREIKERNFALGLNSYTNKEKDEHMLFLDYDTKDMNFVLKDADELVDFFKLSDYEVFQTKKGYHIFFWYDNNLPYSRVKMIINFSRCDPTFKYISRFYDHKTIRASGKYKQKDIYYIGKFVGRRTPTTRERDIGTLKRKEYLALKDMKMFQDNVLRK